ncbi:MAG TPA: GyrI-like domain-containing protein [Saprospiraceae bacterium]|nr:GyrI-like domain-containing protein [Saprospiraceae bacterium]
MSKKLIIAALLALSVITYAVLCLNSPSTFKMVKEIKVSGNMALAYLVVNDVKDWPKWYSWQKEDPTLKFTVGGRDVNVGATFDYSGAKLGKGFTEIQESFKDSLLTAKITCDKLPSDVLASWQILPENQQTVYITYRARLAKPIPFWKRYIYRDLPHTLENRFNADLEGMKAYMEGLINTQFGMKRTDFPARYYVGIKEPVSTSKIPSFYAKSYKKIYSLLDSMKVKWVGPPAGLIYDWQGENNFVYIMAGLPVEKEIKVPVGFSCEKVQADQCIALEHYGHYNTLKNAHAKLDYIIRNLGIQIDAPIIEEYVTSPSQEPDTSKWQTNVFYLIWTKPGDKQAVVKRTYEDMLKAQEAERKRKLEEYNASPQ